MFDMYNKLFKNFILPVADMLNGSAVLKTIKTIENEIEGSSSDIESLQLIKLSRLLEHAVEYSSFYKELSLSKVNDAAQWLKAFPIIDKEIIRNKGNDLLTVPVKKLYPQYSSGSTGVQTKVYWNKQEFDRYWATSLIWWQWAGYDLGDKMLQTGMAEYRSFFKRVKDNAFRTNYFKAYNHNNEDLDLAIDWLTKIKKPVLGGYASSLFVLAKRAEQLNSSIHLKACISWGDKLFEHYKEVINRVFNVNVFETYGSAEGLLIAAQHDLPYMYLMSNNVYLEVVDDYGNEVQDGEIGHAIVTNLNNFSMPLIRYRIGDLVVKLPPNEYPSTRKYNLPLLKKVIGRDTDIVRVKTGERLSVHSFTRIFEYYEGIKQFQIEQKSIDGIVIKYIKGENFEESLLDEIKGRIKDKVKDPHFTITFECVSCVTPSKSGKPQIVVSKLRKASLN